jgi:hypothetical protein
MSDRDNWKRAMAARKKRLAELPWPRPPLLFVCGSWELSTHPPLRTNTAVPGAERP